jgi:hypothetical protein
MPDIVKKKRNPLEELKRLKSSQKRKNSKDRNKTAK